MLHELDYQRPESLDAALAILAEQQGARPLAGGTDLLVDMRAGLATPKTLVDLKGVASLREIAYDPDDGLSIGACVTINEMLGFPPVREHYAILHTAGHELATHALRNRATVVGNLVTASPCGDMASPLLCLGARVTIRSARGSRTIAFSDFIKGVKTTVLAAGEIVERVLVPADMQDAAAGYRKLKRIKGHDLGVVAVALVRKADVIRVAISSAAPTPVLLPDFPADTDAEMIKKAAAERISPIDDVRCTREYRAFMVGVFIERLMAEVPGVAHTRKGKR